MKSNDLQKHVFSTYLTLRYGMAVLAFVFPPLLYVIGKFYGISLQDSMSAYYFALSPTDVTEKVFPLRTWFVGILFTLGAYLYLYKGFSKIENYVLNFAGACAWGVALFPMPYGCGDNCPKLSPHGICAILFFLGVAATTLFFSSDTLYLLPNPALRNRFRLQYRVLGVVMIASPIVALLISSFFKDFNKFTFITETVGFWAFALYWWRKSVELSITEADELAVREELEIPR
jgi:hypothetical protein